MAEAVRIHPLQGRRFATSGILVEPAPAADRLILRCAEKDRDAIGGALGTALPGGPRTSASRDGVSALWLGPDEWLILCEAGSNPASRLAGLASLSYSAVDVSHRNTAIILSGRDVETVLASGCPQDVSIGAFPPGACSRTVLGKSEVVLYRQSVERFRVECWRSFSDYVWHFLVDAAKSV